MSSLFDRDIPVIAASVIFPESPCKNISSELYSKETRKRYGIPTCLAVISDFALIGTSEGFILHFHLPSQDLFYVCDSDRESKVSGKSILNSGNSSAILSLDMTVEVVGKDVSGHFTFVSGSSHGRIQLWLYSEFSVKLLHSINHKNSSPIVQVSFIQKSKTLFASVNTLGQVKVYQVNSFFGVITVDTKRILDLSVVLGGLSGRLSMSENSLPQSKTIISREEGLDFTYSDDKSNLNTIVRPKSLNALSSYLDSKPLQHDSPPYTSLKVTALPEFPNQGINQRQFIALVTGERFILASMKPVILPKCIVRLQSDNQIARKYSNIAVSYSSDFVHIVFHDRNIMYHLKLSLVFLLSSEKISASLPSDTNFGGVDQILNLNLGSCLQIIKLRESLCVISFVSFFRSSDRIISSLSASNKFILFDLQTRDILVSLDIAPVLSNIIEYDKPELSVDWSFSNAVHVDVSGSQWYYLTYSGLSRITMMKSWEDAVAAFSSSIHPLVSLDFGVSLLLAIPKVSWLGTLFVLENDEKKKLKRQLIQKFYDYLSILLVQSWESYNDVPPMGCFWDNRNGEIEDGNGETWKSISAIEAAAKISIEFYCRFPRSRHLSLEDLFERFKRLEAGSVFLSGLQVPVIQGRLELASYVLSKEFLKLLVSSSNFDRFETCVLEIPISFLDLDYVLSISLSNDLSLAISYIYQIGFRDVKSPTHYFLSKIASNSNLGSNFFVLIKYLLNDRIFPSGSLPVEDMVGLKSDLLCILLSRDILPEAAASLLSVEGFGPYPYLKLLNAYDRTLFWSLWGSLMDSTFWDEFPICRLSVQARRGKAEAVMEIILSRQTLLYIFDECFRDLKGTPENYLRYLTHLGNCLLNHANFVDFSQEYLRGIIFEVFRGPFLIDEGQGLWQSPLKIIFGQVKLSTDELEDLIKFCQKNLFLELMEMAAKSLGDFRMVLKSYLLEPTDEPRAKSVFDVIRKHLWSNAGRLDELDELESIITLNAAKLIEISLEKFVELLLSYFPKSIDSLVIRVGESSLKDSQLFQFLDHLLGKRETSHNTLVLDEYIKICLKLGKFSSLYEKLKSYEMEFLQSYHKNSQYLDASNGASLLETVCRRSCDADMAIWIEMGIMEKDPNAVLGSIMTERHFDLREPGNLAWLFNSFTKPEDLDKFLYSTFANDEKEKKQSIISSISAMHVNVQKLLSTTMMTTTTTMTGNNANNIHHLKSICSLLGKKLSEEKSQSQISSKIFQKEVYSLYTENIGFRRKGIQQIDCPLENERSHGGDDNDDDHDHDDISKETFYSNGILSSNLKLYEKGRKSLEEEKNRKILAAFK